MHTASVVKNELTIADTNLFIPDPFLRSNVSDQSTDPLIEAWTQFMPAGLNLEFVDNWDVYHMGLGEVHCGTNVERTPIANWYEVANHLFGGN